uniref:Bromo domain-containing protein n=1 Tax=Phytophthora ramorum TaxID=164328 RepID=H3HDS6_PHYRM
MGRSGGSVLEVTASPSSSGAPASRCRFPTVSTDVCSRFVLRSDSSPVLLEAPERQRAQPVETEEEESEDADTDELEENKEQEDETEEKPRRPSRRLQTQLDVVSPPPSTNHEDVSSASPSPALRYSLRTRHSKPKRFDESIYNDVFTEDAHSRYAVSTPEAAIGSKKRRRRRSRNSNRRAKRQRRRAGDDDDEEEAENEEENHFEADLSIQEINRRIKAQEREDREKAQALERRSRYSLRSRESLTMSETSAVSPPPRTATRNRAAKRSQLEVSAEDDHAEASHDENADNESHSENDDGNSEDEHDDDDGEEAPASSTRYQLRQRRQAPANNNAEEDATASPETSAYAEYQKRQASRASRRNGANGSNRRLFLPDMDTSPPPRRRRSRGSSSSPDVYKDDDDSDGGMRTSSPWRPSKGGRKSGSSRADITPVEVDPSITWDSVGGLKSHIEALKEMVMLPLLYPEFYDKYKVSPPSGVLFYGPPGTGKTLLARALANSCSFYGEGEQASGPKGASTPAKSGKGADCLSKWVGEAERQLRLLFEEAKRNQPSIIFFDEIDGLAPVRSAKQDQIHASIVSTLLALMDGMDSRGRVVVIGATNRLDAIDPALRRPGRFDRELGFKLPSVNERKGMLAIHSKDWKPPLSDTFLTELAEQTVGYCGADIKALCAEATLCSLRRVYPQVYVSEDKLLINLDKVVVARGDFAKAAKKITPASHRAVSSFASPLPRAVKGLLQGQLARVLRDVEDVGANDDGDEDEDDVDIYAIANHVDCDVCHGEGGELLCCNACPGAFHLVCLTDTTTSSPSETQGEGDLWFCPDCRVSNPAAMQRATQRAQKKRVHSIASLHLPRHSGFPRVLIAGKPGMGQQYIGPALLHSLEGLTHFSLDYPSLVADSNSHFPEEALIQRLNEAQKCLPCVLYLPQVELWWKNTSESMHVTLKMMLMNLQVRANLPILFLACTASSPCDEQELPEDLLALFQGDPSVSLTSVVMELDMPSKATRLAHFEQVFTSFATPPSVQKKRRAKDDKLEALPLAPLPPASSEIDLSPEEQRKRKQRDLHFLRELRIFLSQVLDYCYSQRLYTPFYVPVDPVAVPNYYLIVKRSMDLSTMRDKLNDEEYTCFEQFMDDIQLIVRNANVFNPKRSRTRHIAHAAGTMKDNILSYAHRFRIRQGYDLFAKCREVTKRLRAHPSIYGEYGQRFLKSAGKSSYKNQGRVPEKPGVRISLDAAISRATAINGGNGKLISNGVTVKEEATAEVQGPITSKEVSEDSSKLPSSPQVAQWFDDEEEEEEKTSEKEERTKRDSSEKPDDELHEEAEDSEEEAFEEDDRVFVSSRTHPGVNREGGAGFVQSRNKDGTYNVKYILGGTGSVRLIQDEEKMDETDYFDELLWPLLKEEGWRRDDNFDIIEASGKESGLAVQRVVFTTRKTRYGEAVTLNSVMEALAYISADPELSRKCFGTRYAESMMTDEALGGNSSDEEAVEEASSPVDNVAEEKAPAALDAATESSADEPMPEEPVEAPDFIYDEARMMAALTMLVAKTASWSVDKLRDELLLLNKLAYPFRNRFDRSDLMTRTMPIVYALVSREKTVLAEYTATSGNFPTVTRVLLAKIPVADGRMSYVYDRHIFHYIVERGVTFLCMADDDLKRRVPFLFLEDMKNGFQAMYGERALTAIAFAMNDQFQHEIRRLLDYYNANPDADSLSRVKQQIDDVKDIMVQNIDKVLDRGEKFELLVDRTDKLSRQSVKFER